MKFVNSLWNINLQLKENVFNVLVIENQNAMAQIIYELSEQYNGNDGNFILSDNNNLLKFNNLISLVLNPFFINCNEKKIISKLHSQLYDLANDIYYEKTKTLESDIINYLNILIDFLPYDLIFNYEFDIISLFKLQTVKLDQNLLSLTDKILNYIKVCADLTDIKLIIFINLKSFVNEFELLEIYKISSYCKINLLLIENLQRCKMNNECITIIDSDMCLISF